MRVPNSSQLREAWIAGVDARVRHGLRFVQQSPTIAGRVSILSRVAGPGPTSVVFTPAAESGLARNRKHWESGDGAIFAETASFGRLSLVTGKRRNFFKSKSKRAIEPCQKPTVVRRGFTPVDC